MNPSILHGDRLIIGSPKKFRSNDEELPLIGGSVIEGTDTNPDESEYTDQEPVDLTAWLTARQSGFDFTDADSASERPEIVLNNNGVDSILYPSISHTNNLVVHNPDVSQEVYLASNVIPHPTSGVYSIRMVAKLDSFSYDELSETAEHHRDSVSIIFMADNSSPSNLGMNGAHEVKIEHGDVFDLDNTFDGTFITIRYAEWAVFSFNNVLDRLPITIPMVDAYATDVFEFEIVVDADANGGFGTVTAYVNGENVASWFLGNEGITDHTAWGFIEFDGLAQPQNDFEGVSTPGRDIITRFNTMPVLRT